ncbi:MAG: DUF1559 domain-containing protein, partial [Planctomycetaceae bacterium]|nr:DUF1559 domain-containing protein [Planctomycetaceae bacterium]
PATQNMNTGWSASVLPWLEQRALFDALNLGVVYDHPANATATYTVLHVYLCPTEPRKTYWNRAPGDKFDHADADYGGMYGERGLSSPRVGSQKVVASSGIGYHTLQTTSSTSQLASQQQRVNHAGTSPVQNRSSAAVPG